MAARDPSLATEFPVLDVFGLDSPYDYDPVWRCCQELGYAPTFHSNGRGRAFGLHNSRSNFTYNHIGHFAAAAEAVCKALILGGVTNRFSDLNFGFLEGGVGWACQLYSDLLGHWEKRNLKALGGVDPVNLDWLGLLDVARDYALDEFVDIIAGRVNEIVDARRALAPQEGLDHFEACGFETEADVVRQFTGGLYFGCGADDPINAWAFRQDHLPYGVQLKVLFGTDIDHFDVPDMTAVLPEAYELVDDGLTTPNDFRHFVFDNAVMFF